MQPLQKLGELQHVALMADRLDVVLVEVAGLEEGPLARKYCSIKIAWTRLVKFWYGFYILTVLVLRV
jgi:hypothetical protein